jgi:lipoprotein-releasing system ATP-binding protein
MNSPAGQPDPPAQPASPGPAGPAAGQPARSDQAGAIEVIGVHKSYRLGKTSLHVLRGVSFRIEPGEFVAVVGASGSGKSTLLHLLGLLDRPDRGEVHLGGVNVETLSASQRDRMRCREIGFVFQFYHLLPELNVLENVLLPAKVDASTVAWLSRRAAKRAQAAGMLQRVDLQDRLLHRPKELSGGERQRVAIARALMNLPKFLLADEPTGNLDSQTGKQILTVVREVSRQIKQTVVMVTHDADLAAGADRVLHLRDGKLAKP